MERILACVSAAPSSRNVVLKALDLAAIMQAHVVAVHVQPAPHSARISRDQVYDRAMVDQNLALARSAGAEIVMLTAADVAKAVIEYAELSRITRIVVGKNESVLPRRMLRRRDLVERLIAETKQMDVYVVPGDPSHYQLGARGRRRSLIRKRLGPWETLLTAAFIGVAAAVSLFLHSVGFSDANIVLVFLLAVLAATFFIGRLPGIVSSLLGVLAFNYLFIEPRFTLVVYDTQYLLTFFVMLSVSLTTSELLSRIRSEAVASRRRADLTVAVYRFTRTLLNISGESAVVGGVLQQLVRTFGGSAVWFCGDPSLPESEIIVRHDNQVVLEKGTSTNLQGFDRELAAWTFHNARAAGYGTSSYPNSQALYVPLVGVAGTMGVLAAVMPEGYEPAVDSEQRTLFETLAGQVALALERERVARRHEEVSVQVEAERLRNYLLRSISHDLRTPLAGIAGSAAVLADLQSIESVQQIRQLGDDIYEQATWLSGLVENLLSLTRIEGDSPNMKLEAETVDDLIGSVLGRMRRRLQPFRVKTMLPANVVSVPVDAGLIQQVLVNILENACRHTPRGGSITIDAETMTDCLQICITDSGCGFTDADFDHLFEKFYTGSRRDADTARGVGLGLAICHAIVVAHGGTITAANANAGGAQICIRLPVGQAVERNT